MTGGDSTDGMPHALAEAYLAHRPGLLRFLRARGAGDDADDLAQDLWLSLSASTVPVANPVGYLYRAADNLMISRHRSSQRLIRRNDQWARVFEPSPLDHGEAVETRDAVERAERQLRALGGRVLQVFTLFRIDGMLQRDIAARLNISLSSVEKDLQRAYRTIAAFKSEIDDA